jgi:hypothetical protein
MCESLLDSARSFAYIPNLSEYLSFNIGSQGGNDCFIALIIHHNNDKLTLLKTGWILVGYNIHQPFVEFVLTIYPGYNILQLWILPFSTKLGSKLATQYDKFINHMQGQSTFFDGTCHRWPLLGTGNSN